MTEPAHGTSMLRGAGLERDGQEQSRPPRRPALHSSNAFNSGQRPPPPEWLKGRCFRCFSKRHRACDCRDPVKCARCFFSGHRARSCNRDQQPLPGPDVIDPSPRLLRLRQACAPAPARAPDPAMERWGGAADRPLEDFVVIHASPEMNAEAATLMSNAAYAWFDRPPQRDERDIMARALRSTFRVTHDDLALTDHYPEAFLVRFIHLHHCLEATSRHDFVFEGHRTLAPSRPCRAGRPRLPRSALSRECPAVCVE
uniref:Uncharacterized protein n=1 Tax=Avena sativa TaxID=4498 RepID=A0ACD6AJ22_AVESA